MIEPDQEHHKEGGSKYWDEDAPKNISGHHGGRQARSEVKPALEECLEDLEPHAIKPTAREPERWLLPPGRLAGPPIATMKKRSECEPNETPRLTNHVGYLKSVRFT